MIKKFAILLVFCCLWMCGYAQGAAQILPDYKVLALECKEKESVGCCMASVKAMEAGQYLLDEGKTFKETTCPQGFRPDMMKCPDSYRWCVPVEPQEEQKKSQDTP